MPYFLLSLAIGVSLFFNDIYNSKSIGILIITAFSLFTFHSLKKAHLHLPLIITTYSLIIINFLVFQFSQTKTVGLSELILETTLLLLFLFLIHNQRLSPKIIYPVIGFAILQTIFGVYQAVSLEEIRIAGTFQNWHDVRNYFPNALALFYLLTIPLVVTLKKQKFLFLALTTLFAGLLLTLSRGALTIFIFQIILILIYLLYNKERKTVLTILVSLIVASTLFFNLATNKTQLSQKYQFAGTEKQTSVQERQNFFKYSLQLIRQNPLLGTGIGSFEFVYPQVQPKFLGNAPHPHNIFLKIATERGLLTLAVYLIFISFLVKIIYQNRKSILTNKQLFIYLTAFSGGLLHNLIDYNLNFTSNYLIFTILLALLISPFLNKTNTTPKKHYLNLILLLIIIATSIGWTHKEFSLFQAKKIPQLATTILTDLNYKNSNYLLADLATDSSDKIKIYQQQVAHHQHDAVIFNKLGDLSPNTNQKVHYYALAVNKDPKNNWIYYKNYFQHFDPNKLEQFENLILKELNYYQTLANQNIYYTAQHDNLNQAVEIAKIFLAQTKNQEFQTIIDQLLESSAKVSPLTNDNKIERKD